MREARVNGKRLSDVVEVTWQHLKAAKAPICYLRALLRNPVDFGHQLRVKAQADEVTIRLNKLKMRADRSAKQHAGQTFVDAHGETTYVVGKDAESMTIYKAGEGIGRQATNWKQEFLQAIERGFIRKSTDAPTATVSPTLPARARQHLAGLRGLLRPKAIS
jgi:hypothetical protein